MMRSFSVWVALVLFLTIGCASSIRPLEAERLEMRSAQDASPALHSQKNPWIAGALGLAAPACNLYLAYGTGRNEQLSMAIINLATWPFSVAWAIPGCVLDTKTVNQLSTLRESTR